jgi:hypothetical protein
MNNWVEYYNKQSTTMRLELRERLHSDVPNMESLVADHHQLLVVHLCNNDPCAW